MACRSHVPTTTTVPQETPIEASTMTTTVKAETPWALLVLLLLRKEFCTLKKKMKKEMMRTTRKCTSMMASWTPSRVLTGPMTITKHLQKYPQKRTRKVQLRNPIDPHRAREFHSATLAIIGTIESMKMVILQSPKMRTYWRSRVFMTQLTTWNTYTWNAKGILPYGISRYKFVCLPAFVTYLVSYLTVHTARPPG